MSGVSGDIAIVGMAGRFPGAPDVATFWRNLRDGVESITFWDTDTLRAGGIAEETLADPSYVRAASVLTGIEDFDAAFFGYHAREAALIDPQQRLFLECAWHALEDAGYAPGAVDATVGVYAGSALSTYLLGNVLAGRVAGTIGETLELLVTNDKDYLPNRVSFKLGLGGPAVAVQTACSSSLVAVHVAAQALLEGECDVALAGGAAIRLPQPSGYLWQEGLIFSRDGHCRPFDAAATGTVFGSGVGVVVLKRLEDALADGDHVEAVIRGSAVTNDGSAKVGYTAPGVDGQARAVATALGIAGVDPATVTAIEAHGTGTPLGDPIEVTALNKVFAPRMRRRGGIALASVKSNVGHLDTAAGVTGLIKAVLQLKHRELVPSLHYDKPNPEIDFDSSPFRVNTELREWTASDVPRRIGVSSFGMGGTNAHVVVEEAPTPAPLPPPARATQVITLSARTPEALDEAAAQLTAALAAPDAPPLADVAWTLHRGRGPARYRRTVVATDAADAAVALADPTRTVTGTAVDRPRLVFLFPGQGSQYPGMGAELYATEPAYRDALDAVAADLEPHLGLDLRTVLHPADDVDPAEAARRLESTDLAQPALFAVEYATAALLAAHGITPDAMIGHSVGELTAACLAGVLDRSDAARLVAARGRLMAAMPPGAMLSVALGEDEVRPLLTPALSLAAANAPELCVVSGPDDDVAALQRVLAERGVSHRRLHTSHAFHSAMMDPVRDPFTAELAGIRLAPPKLPFVANRTGEWITDREATDPAYWAGHVRDTVRFGASVALVAGPDAVLLEVGPGRTLGTLARQVSRDATVLASMPAPGDVPAGTHPGPTLLGRLWAAGVDVDLAADGPRRRVSLPGYPFQRRRYWISPGGQATALDLAGLHGGGADPAADPSAGLDGRPNVQTAYVAPRDDRERLVAAIWQDLLGAAPIGVDDNFVELGGHSLLATRVVARVNEAFGIRIGLREMLAAPTVAGVAALVAAGRAADTGIDEPDPGLPPAVPAPDQAHEPFPLAEIQQAQWLGRLGSVEGGNVAAHVYWEVETGEVDLDRLTASWQEVVRRHGMLRAVIGEDGRQRILPDPGPYVIEVTDLRDRPADAVERSLAELRETLSHQMRPVDVWPLWDVRATLLPGGRTRLHLGFDLMIADIGSIRLLSRDWRRIHQGVGDLAPLDLSYRDYVLATEELRGSPLHRRSLDYWRQRIAELPPRPDLPLAVAPAAVTRPEPVSFDLKLDRDTWRRITERAGGYGLTPSSVLLAVYAYALGAWCRSGRFTVNVTVTNRLPVHPHVGDLVGEFASFDLLPVDLAAAGSVERLARHLQEQSWQDLEHRYVSGVEVLREMARARGGAAGAVTPVVFTSTVVQESEPGDETWFGWLGDMVHEVAQTPQVWLDFALLETADGVRMSWHGVRQLFPDGVLDAVFAAFSRLTTALAEGESAWREDPGDLRPSAQRELVAAANDTAGPPAAGLLHDPLLGWARREPDRPAVIDADGVVVSYGELSRHAHAVAHRLRALGVERNELVAVAVDKSAAQVAAALGVLLAGAAYLPVDPDLPAERQDHLVTFGRCRAVLSRVDGPRRTWPDGVTELTVDLTAEAPAGHDEPLPAADPDDLAYVIFTSGSTGTPKGVMIRHRAARNTVDDVTERWSIGPDDAALGLSSLSFDLSVYDVFGLLGAGGRLVLPRHGSNRDPGHWVDLVTAHRVTVWNSVPALAQMLADHVAGHGPADALAAVRLFLMSGDWIPVDLPERLRELAPACLPVSLGGATEASIWSICHEIREVDPSWESIPYGRAMRNQSFHVLNDRWQECPVWVTGELFIGGVGLADGYWRDEERTAGRFVTRPATGERLYRTGDLGRWRPDGTIEFLGREDFQVKIGGYRIELGEIEAVLGRHPGVAAAVAAAPGDRHHRRLVAYLVPADPAADRDALVEEVRAEAASALPSYMVPQALLTLDRLPLSVNGKVDRAALPDPARSAGEARPTGEATPTALLLARLIGEVLNQPEVGPFDNFFAVGGDSITGIQIVSRAAAEGLELTPADLFAHQVVAELAAVADARSPGGRAGADAGFPLTPWQRTLVGPDGPARPLGVQVLDVPVAAGLDSDAASRVLGALVAAHPALRVRLVADPDGWRQRVGVEDEPYVPLIDLAPLPAARRDAARTQMVADIRAELDPVDGPLTRAALFDLGDGERRLVWLVADLAVDARSWPTLCADLRRALVAVAAGGDPQPAAPPVPLARWAERAAGETAPDGSEPVDETDSGATSVEDVLSLPSGPAGPGDGCRRTVTVPAERASALLDAASRTYRLTADEVVLAALAAALHATGARRAVVDVERDLRADGVAELDATGAVGPYATVVPVRLALTDDLAELVPTVKRRHRAATPVSGARPAQLLLRHLGDLDGTAEEPAIAPRAHDGPGHRLVVTGHLAGGALLVEVYAPAAGEADVATLDALADALADALTGLAAHCARPDAVTVDPSDFPLAGLGRDDLAAFLTAVTSRRPAAGRSVPDADPEGAVR
ncbi:hybrid non-ribosomal peptide synthetase/type I polyketide synthase [Micromonospora halophytica]|uniref:Phenyloxazoline synthase MbtB n=1 Tax=Micromonospora halophytica TaxID=47864 RepID=A0A1C5I7E1_9ACTN|nr:hybrid non-ribosomal peptide synthetase/type I polyketide synthase [Micromonospora halophytica]SCG54230.1 amino acid adenylation domain-containing protein [Micromonospora halophytica]